MEVIPYINSTMFEVHCTGYLLINFGFTVFFCLLPANETVFLIGFLSVVRS